MKRMICALAFILLCYSSGFATPQEPDYLLYNGETYYLDTSYLEQFFEDNPDKIPNIEGFVTLTSLWRGYIATFEIEDGQLYLTDIEVRRRSDESGKIRKESILKEVFPDADRVKADWFTGILWGGNGKRKYPFEYSNYCIFEIDRGNIIKKKELNRKEYNKFKKEQVKAFEKTSEYQSCFDKIKEEHNKGMSRMHSYTQTMIDSLNVRLAQNDLTELGGITMDEEKLRNYVKDLEETRDSYANARGLSDKEVKKIINFRIFSYISKFIE